MVTNFFNGLRNKDRYKKALELPDGSVVNNQPAKVRNTGSIPDPGRSHMPQGN